MNRISEVASGAGVAAALVVVFVLCAIVELVAPNIRATHMWVDLFTSDPTNSVTAWVVGILSSAVGGFVAGYVFAWKYNRVTAYLGR